MRLSCQFEELLSNLVSSSVVVDDALVSEDMRNIIFDLSKDKGFRLISTSKLITHKLTIPEDSYTMDLGDAEGFRFQLKSKTIINYLNAYKTLRRTYVDEVIFEDVSNKIKCTIIEKDKTEDDDFGFETDDEKTYVSSWVFTQVPIKPSILGYLTKEAPTDVDMTDVNSDYIKVYTSSMLPLMQNVTSMFGKLAFTEKYVIAFSSAYTAMLVNALPINGVLLSYKAVSFLDKVICNSPIVSIAKSGTDLFCRTDTSETFIMYESKLPNYEPYVTMNKREHCVVIDRIYLKDVLKRFSLVDENIACDIKANAGVVTMKNTSYSQELEIISSTAMESFEQLSFKILPAVFDKAIIGDDNACCPELSIYYNDEAGCLILSDEQGQWFTVVRVKIS